MPRLGIAVVHYHAEELLARCLGALEESTFGDFEVVVADNGSASGLAWVTRRDARYRVVATGANVGFAAATNLALARLGPGELVLLLNPDVFVEPHTLEAMVALLEREPDVGAATCRLVRPNGTLDPACRRSDPTLFSAAAKQLGLQALFPHSRRFGSYNLTYLDADAAHDIDSGTAAFLLLRRAALIAAGGGLDERFFLYGEDLDLCRRIRLAGYRIRYWPQARAVHVKGSGRPRGARATIEFHRAMWIYYRKWGTFRRNGLVLVPLFGAIAALGAVALVAGAVRSRSAPAESR